MEPTSKYIELVNGGRARVDASDYDSLTKHRWFKDTGGYAHRQGWNGPRDDSANHWVIWMHREVNGTPEGLYTDHINEDKLDNRRCNLRTVDKSRNSTNRPKSKRAKVSSKLKGVSFHKATGLWRARITNRGKHHTTYHQTEMQAALDYNRMARELFGDYAAGNRVPQGIMPTERRQKSSRFRGVTRRDNNKWEASINPEGKYVFLGVFDSEEDAARAYNEAALKLRGERAKLNAV